MAWIIRGQKLFQYLGVPLAVVKLNGMYDITLIDKIEQSINAWISKTVSYETRIELI